MDKELKTRFALDDELTIRTFVKGDAETVFNSVRNNPEHLQLMQWMSKDYSLESAMDFIERAQASLEKKENLGFGIFRNGTHVGAIGYVYLDWNARKTEIGYWLTKDEEGRGTISAACRRLIDYAFDELNFNRIEIRCSAENVRSAAVPERLGFTREAHLRQSELRHGKLHDFEIYGLLADDPRLW